MARELKPCGTFAASMRHRRNPDTYGPLSECEPCLRASREQKQERVDQARAESAESVREAVATAPAVDVIDPLDEALDNLRIVRAVLRDGETPANTIAALTKRRDDLVDRIERLRAASAPVEVSVIDELTNRRRERRAEATG